MPIYTFYIYKPPKNRRVPVYTTSEEPCDWANLRSILQEVALITWNEHKLCEFLVSLEKHLSGAYNMKWRRSGYSPRRIFYKRQPEFFCRLTFNPLSRALKIRGASFGPIMMDMLEDYRFFEKNQKYRVPGSVIPKSDEGILGILPT